MANITIDNGQPWSIEFYQQDPLIDKDQVCFMLELQVITLKVIKEIIAGWTNVDRFYFTDSIETASLEALILWFPEIKVGGYSFTHAEMF